MQNDNLEVILEKVLNNWQEFEEYVSNLNGNSRYFSQYFDIPKNQLIRELNFDNYYKGTTLSADIVRYFREDHRINNA